MSFEDFIKKIKRDPNLREGQQFMNEIYSERPDIYWLIINDKADCFYDNSTLPKAKEIAARYWNC